ncbi:MAG TPA: hypothetical protein VKW78_14780 [Terriglobales bacterium]|nr:hypothetical protein [Terriglobales bacterium]
MIRVSISKLSSFVRRLLHRNPEPMDPYTSVRQPLKRGPAGRGAAVALEEPRA